jgi:hypothetical protein
MFFWVQDVLYEYYSSSSGCSSSFRRWNSNQMGFETGIGGEIYRSIPKERYTSARCKQQQQAILSIASTNKNRASFPVGIPFFKFDSIKEILEA